MLLYEKINKAYKCLIFFFFFFKIRHSSVLLLDFFLATNFRSSEHSKEKLYKVHTQSGLSWSMIFIGTGTASCKQLF